MYRYEKESAMLLFDFNGGYSLISSYIMKLPMFFDQNALESDEKLAQQQRSLAAYY